MHSPIIKGRKYDILSPLNEILFSPILKKKFSKLRLFWGGGGPHHKMPMFQKIPAYSRWNCLVYNRSANGNQLIQPSLTVNAVSFAMLKMNSTMSRLDWPVQPHLARCPPLGCLVLLLSGDVCPARNLLHSAPAHLYTRSVELAEASSENPGQQQ